jgi:hypothetical protein
MVSEHMIRIQMTLLGIALIMIFMMIFGWVYSKRTRKLVIFFAFLILFLFIALGLRMIFVPNLHL